MKSHMKKTKREKIKMESVNKGESRGDKGKGMGDVTVINMNISTLFFCHFHLSRHLFGIRIMKK